MILPIPSLGVYQTSPVIGLLSGHRHSHSYVSLQPSPFPFAGRQDSSEGVCGDLIYPDVTRDPYLICMVHGTAITLT